MRLAVVMMAMAPEHQFFEHEERQDAKQHGRCRSMHISVRQGVRQNFQKGSPEQGTDRIGDQHADAMDPQRNAQCRSGKNAQRATGQRDGYDPGKSAHGNLQLEKGADYTPAGQFGRTACASSSNQRRNAATEGRCTTALRITRK